MTYRMKYNFSIERGAFAKADLGASGGTDALVIGSILYDEDGSSSTAWFSQDGRTGDPLAALDLFKAWNMLAAQLEDDPDLSAQLRAIARDSLEAMRRHLGVVEKKP